MIIFWLFNFLFLHLADFLRDFYDCETKYFKKTKNLEKKTIVMEAKTKPNYESPKLDVVQVVTEGAIAVSPTFTGDLDWKPDPNPTPAAYDGDVWVNF